MEDNPQPYQIQDYPRDGELEHIFRKQLTGTDTTRGLVLTGESDTYFRRTLSQSMRDQLLVGGSILVMLYTPKISKCSVTMKCRKPETLGNFVLWKTGWVEALEENGYKSGDTIDCWCVYTPSAEGDNGETLNLLIQKVFQIHQQVGAAGGQSVEERNINSFLGHVKI